MIEVKSHAVYANEYFVSSDAMDRRITGFLALTSSSSIAGWVVWKDYSFVWGSLIAASQVINALRPVLPYQKRIAPLRALSYAYEDLFLQIEAKWGAIERGEFSEEEIDDILGRFRNDKAKLWRKTIDSIAIPHDEALYRKADQLAEQYFRTHYHL